MRFISSYWAQFMHTIESLDRQQWVYVLVVVCVAGFLCLRGMGIQRV